MGKIFQNKKVLITGGLGFIGSNLAKRLVKMNAEVTIVDSLIPEYGGNLFNIKGFEDRLKINISDVRDVHSMKYLVQGMDYLFNLAGQTSHMDSMSDPFTDLEINSKAQLSILEACRKNNPDIKIVFASTRQIYGRPQYLPVDEKHPSAPIDVNGINKLAGEQYHVLYNNVYGIRCSILRLTNTYGPGMRIKDARQTFVGIWIKNAIEGKPFEVWGGEQLRDFTFVDDAVNAFLLCAAKDNANGKVYNLGGERNFTLKKLAKIIETFSGCEYHIRDFPSDRKVIDIGDYYSDYSKIKSELNWEPETSLETGMKHTFNFYKAAINHYL
ncbi:MAG: NAD-dependent epimerase/dehydratase [Candidatus Uhrbacteria bacterium GW2011_GWF2_39_13]|uniref:NAD-dependent epimerase/dehydratase n=1 Tax=Candidatus Uhrbacteria bacterium GW2011_GWF2_39_13 TaxID=1618995 RepID=A0A0G0MTX5_9BACT|nr:MAG: NAD-dependent epimerase/dehydratase [Candidatus Uhrbacteria bacterium GW2011_GWF2_39_13]